MDSVISPGVPYFGLIPKGLVVGKAIIVNGTIPSNSYRFNIDLVCGDKKDCNENSDVALHVSVRFDQKLIVRNSYLNKNWMEEEREPPLFPVAAGRKFEMIVLTEETHYKIAINGHHVAEFKHRFPFHAVKAIYIKGEVQISKIAFHSLNVPKFGKLGYPSCTIPQSNAQICPAGPSLYPPVYNPAIPLNHKFKDGLNPMVISVSGRPTKSAHRFSINFLTESDDIALHMDVRFGQRKVVKNSKINNVWGAEEFGSMIFKPGVNFDLVINISNESFQFVANGQFYGVFQHRLMPLSRISMLNINEDVILSSIQFI